MFKKNVINGLLTAIGFTLFLVAVFTIVKGLSWWSSSDNDSPIFFLLWAALAFYVGYGTSKYYFVQKNIIYINTSLDESQKKEKWGQQRKYMYSKLLMILAKFFAILTPFYILAYIDKSVHIQSGITYIVSFAVISLLSLIFSKLILAKK